MAGNMITNTAVTYSDVSLRENLSDIIYNVSPTEVPFSTSCAKSKATAVYHEWTTDALASPNGSNAAVQGDDLESSFDAVNYPTRIGNRTQISRKSLIVSATDETVLKAGRKSSIAYNIMKKGKELKRDIEKILLANQAAVAAAAGTAPLCGAILSWLYTNYDIGAGGAQPAASNGTDTRTDGTQRTLTETSVKNVLQQIFTVSGEEPDMMMLGPVEKQVASGFSGNETRMQDTKDKKLVSAIDVYVHDFGSIRVVPNRFQRSRDGLIINSDYWAIAWLRPITMVELAKTGDAEKRMLVGEYTLEARNEMSSGIVADLL